MTLKASTLQQETRAAGQKAARMTLRAASFAFGAAMLALGAATMPKKASSMRLGTARISVHHPDAGEKLAIVDA